jgi:hypothetical protein
MTPAACRLPRDNPFASRHVRPGALPFLFAPGEGLLELIDRLESQGWWGQIIGPHGSGKSTLLAALLPELERRGLAPQLVRLCQEQRYLPEDLSEFTAAAGPRLVVIDGFEQLGWWTRRRLKVARRRSGSGLVVTAHRSMGLPYLYRTAVTPAQAQRLLDALLNEKQRRLVEPLNLTGALAARRGNFREVLFDLYDLYEERSRGRPG